MTTEEAREIIIKERDSLKANPMVKVENCLYEAFDMAIKALEQQPCEDAISRQAVLDLINANWKYEGLETDVASLPSVTPKAVQKWIPCTDRLPDKLQDVLVTFYDAEGEYDVAYMRKTFNATYIAQGAENEWVSAMGETTYADYEVSAWMPLMPYKAESEDKK